MKRNQIYFCLLTILLIALINDALLSQTWKESMSQADKEIQLKDYKSALISAFKSIDYAKKEFGESTEYEAQSLNKIGEIYYLAKNYDNSIKYYTDSKDLLKQLGLNKKGSYTSTLNNLSALYQNLGRYSEAEPLLKEAIQIKKEISGANDTSYAKSLNNLAQLYQEMARYSDAESLYLEALKIKKDVFGTQNTSFALSCLSMGILYYTLGNYDKAQSYLNEALPVLQSNLGENNPETIKAILNLARTYMALDKPEDAQPLLKKAQEFQKNNSKSDPDYPATLFNMAMLKWTMKDYATAKSLLEEAMQLIEARFGNGYPLYASCLNSLGVISWMQEDYNKAYEYLSKTVMIREKTLGENHPDYATSINNLAGLLKDMGKFDDAENYYHKAFALYLDQINKYFTFLSEKEKDKFYSTLKERFELFNCYVVTRKDANPQLIDDMYDFQIATKALLLSSSRNIRNRIQRSGDNDLIEKYNSWLLIKEKLSNLYNLTKQEVQKKGGNIDSLESITNNLEKELSKKSSAFENEFDKKQISWKDIQKKLKADEAVVEIIRFRFFDKRWTDTIFYAALILTKETINHPDLVLINNGFDMENLAIKNYTKSIRFKIPDNDSYPYFWKSIDEKLKGKKTIYLSPDGIYNKINVNTFRKPDYSYVIDAQNIILLTNSSDLLKYHKTQKSPNKNVELFGYPDYNFIESPNSQDSKENNRDASKNQTIKDLPGTKIEVEQISELFKTKKWNVSDYLSREATETNIKKSHDVDILHIATHGYFLDDVQSIEKPKVFGIDIEKAAQNPLLRSGLLLTGASNILLSNQESSDKDNGVLTALEAMNLDLENTGLVVLSACETGLGEVRNGEGVYGLQRAFQVAGAKNVLMSLWKIDDDATQELMTKFYKNWLAGSSYVEAFRKAQLELKSNHPEPYYWGAFEIIGD